MLRAKGCPKEATVQLLFFKHHRLAGVRGWELRKELGSDWRNVLDVLDKQIKPLDLRVTRNLISETHFAAASMTLSQVPSCL